MPVIRSGACQILLVVLLFCAATTDQAQANSQSEPFTYIIMGDSQIPWWPEMDLPAACDFEEADEDPGQQDSNGNCGKESNDQRAEPEGNNGCKWTWKDDKDGPQHCASRLENTARGLAIRQVHRNANGGVWPVSNDTLNGGNPIRKPAAVIINGDLTSYMKDWQLEDYYLYYGVLLAQYPVLAGLGNHDYENNYGSTCSFLGSTDECYNRGVDLGYEMVVGQRVGNFPAYWVQSFDDGSLAYRWSQGNYVFLQLHNYPQYHQRDDDDHKVFDSVAWLEDEVDAATAAGKYVVLNLHDDEKGINDDSDIRAIIRGSSVVAVFSGHSIAASSLGWVRNVTYSSGNEVINDFGDPIPMFRSGHSGEPAIDHKFLLVEFDVDSFTVAAMYTGQSTGGGNPGSPEVTPEFVNDNDDKYLATYTIGAPAVPEPAYGFVAIGAPDEDVYSDIGRHRENDAGVVNVYYRQDNRSRAFGQQWTQNNLGGSVVEGDDQHGFALAAGDFNGDGYPDLASGSPFEDVDGDDDAGLVSVVYGTLTGLHGRIQVITQATVDANVQPNDRFGHAVAAGDFNGDGYDDLAVGVPYEDVNCDGDGDESDGDNSGAVNVFYGSANGLTNTHDGYFDQTETDEFNCEGDDRMGYALAVGDFDNDGYDDLAVGVPGEDVGDENDAGAIGIFRGGSNGLVIQTGRSLVQSQAFGGSNEADDAYGFALASGDFNGDSYWDLAVGAPTEDVNCDLDGSDSDGDNAGAVSVMYGSEGGIQFDDSLTFDQRFIDGWNCEADDHMGYALASGDFDGDGRYDLAIGLPEEDIEGDNDAGGVIIVEGDDDGLQLATAYGFTQDSLPGATSEGDDRMGYALAAGDVDIDGQDDLAIGSPGEDSPSDNDIGLVHLMYGTLQGLRNDSGDVQGLNQFTVELVTDGFNGNDHFGAALALSPRRNTPPQVDAGPDLSVPEGGMVELTGSVIDPDVREHHNWRWTIIEADNDGCRPPQFVPHVGRTWSFAPEDDCEYRIRVKVTDRVGEFDRDSMVLSVTNVAPVIDSIAGDEIEAGDIARIEVHFTDPGNDFFDAEVDWGDGNTTAVPQFSGQRRFTAIYDYPDDGAVPPGGVYSINVTLNDDDGGSTTATTQVTILNEPPVIDSFGADAGVIDEGDTVTISGTYSDTDAEDSHTVTIGWGDGAAAEPCAAEDGAFSCAHTYVDDNPSGTPSDIYTVQVTVDDGIAQATDSLDITVNNVAPQLDVPTEVAIDGDGNASVDIGYSDIGTQDELALQVDWGDGATSNPALSGSPASVSHAYDISAGVPASGFSINISLVDDDTGSTTESTNALLVNVAPVLDSLALAAATINEGGTASVSGGFTDLNLDDSHSITIDWGDGSAPQTEVMTTGERTFEFEHGYADDNPTATPADDYTISVTVSDGELSSATATTVLTVQNVAPQVTNLAGDSILENQVASINGAFEDAGALDSFILSIDWGDGSTETQSHPSGTRAFGATHHYPDDNPTGTPADDYVVTITLADDDTGTTVATTTVTVTNVPPTATIDQLIDALTGLTVSYELADGTPVPGALPVLPAGNAIDLQASYRDPGPQDQHSPPDPTINWGDGTMESITIATQDADADGSYGTTGPDRHRYNSDLPAGAQVIELAITDDDTGIGVTTATIQLASPADGLLAVLAAIEAALDQGNLSPGAEAALLAAMADLAGNPEDNGTTSDSGALDHLDRDNLIPALNQLAQALEALVLAEASDASLDLGSVKTLLALSARSLVEEAIDLAAANVQRGNDRRKVEAAVVLRDEGDEALGSGDHVVAVEHYTDAVKVLPHG